MARHTTRLAIGLLSLATLVLAFTVSCSGGSSTSPTSPTGGTASEPSGNPPAPTEDDGGGPTAATAPEEGTDGTSSPGTPNAGAPTPEPPFPASQFGVPVGTEPAFVGSPYDAQSFPFGEVISVLPSDAIPALTDPVMARQDAIGYLADSDLVFGVIIDGDARAYPHNIGWWHEIVNDVVGGRGVCVTFCPLTGTGLVFDGGDPDTGRLTLGVSGMLYNTNLVMYSKTDGRTLYPQIYAAGVRGPGTGMALRLLPVVETTWSTWKRLYPDTRVVASGPYGVSQYTVYPYGDYRTNNADFLFPVRPNVSSNPNPNARRLGTKDLVLGLRVDGETLAFPLDGMGDRQVINEVVGGLEVAVIYDRDAALAIPYSRRVDDRILTLDLVDDGSFPYALSDRETGTLWDIKGIAVEGELAGRQLAQVPAHTSMWFAWVTFWPDTEVWVP